MGRKEEEQEDAYLKRMHVHRCVNDVKACRTGSLGEGREYEEVAWPRYMLTARPLVLDPVAGNLTLWPSSVLASLNPCSRSRPNHARTRTLRPRQQATRGGPLHSPRPHTGPS